MEYAIVSALLVCLIPLVALSSWRRGQAHGIKRGYDSGWVDHQLDTAKRDRERRDRRGRFIALKSKRHGAGGNAR